MLDFCGGNGAYSDLVGGTDVNGSVGESNSETNNDETCQQATEAKQSSFRRLFR